MKRILLLPSAAVLLTTALAAGAQSLYGEGSFRALTDDPRARAIGDSLTILVVENSSASATANTSADKNAGVGVTLTGTTRTEKGALDVNESFAGKGSIQRSGRLVAQLTVSVLDMAPNGDLWVGGRQIIEVNGEKQQIDLRGRVRRVDISESNTVLSSRLADARISYLGDGVLGEKQHVGIVGRILSWLGIL